MTIITAVSRDGEAAIAADTRVSFGDGGLYHDCSGDSKISEFSFGYVGFAGSPRLHQVVGGAWKGWSKTSLNNGELLKLCDAASEACRAAALDPSAEDDNKDFEAIILDNEGVIWVIDSEFGFFRPGEYAAVGSGAPYALGALKVLCKSQAKSFCPQKTVMTATEVACGLCAHCGGEIDLHYID